MLMIRFQRIGRKNDPAFRIAVLEKTAGPKAGKYVEQVGSYNPKTKITNLNEDRIKYWMGTGAQVSDSLHNLLIVKGVIEGKKINVLPKKTVPVKEAEVVETPAPAAPAAEVTEVAPEVEAPAAEVAAEEVAAELPTEAEVEAEAEPAPAEEAPVEETPVVEEVAAPEEAPAAE
jgi:small subunit ribosomal protein S16